MCYSFRTLLVVVSLSCGTPPGAATTAPADDVVTTSNMNTDGNNHRSLIQGSQMLEDVPPQTKKIEVQLDEGDLISVSGDGKELAREKITRK